METKRVVMLNSSALRRSACMRRLNYVLSGYREKMVGNDIIFGTCFHDFAAHFVTTGDFGQSVEVGWKARLREKNLYTKFRKEYLDDPAFFRGVCTLWAMERSDWKTVKIADTTLVELPWAYPFYVGEHIEVVLCGTVDSICEHKINEGVMSIKDYKTTSALDSSEYFAKYKMSLQLMFYYFGITKLCEMKPDSALAKKWLGASTSGVMIEGIFIKKSLADCEFKKSELFTFSKERMNEFESMLISLCEQLDKPANHEWPRQGLVNAACESEGYGRKCAFFDCCSAESNDEGEMILRASFSREKYDPLSI